jgi:hypothetical protein
VLLTRLPLGIATSFDLHVLGTPPALVLSQDQTLHKKLWSLMMALNLLFVCTKSRDSKDIARMTLSYYVGDPQTFALLHCSVFKERT